MIGDYRSHFVSLTFIVVSLRPRVSFALVFLDILTTMIDIRRLDSGYMCWMEATRRLSY